MDFLELKTPGYRSRIISKKKIVPLGACHRVASKLFSLLVQWFGKIRSKN